jgi:hypothetical protein
MACSDCKWFVPLADGGAGDCHGAPPTTSMMLHWQVAESTAGRTDSPVMRRVAVWPVVMSGDFCGGHTPTAPIKNQHQKR